MLIQFAGIDGVFIIQDDCLIVGCGNSEEEAKIQHNKRLNEFLKRCEQRGVQMNIEKSEFLVEKVRYMGHVISKEGLSADPEKVKAIVNMPAPTDVNGVRRFLGMIKYLSRFSKNLSELCEPLNNLLRKDVAFMWSPLQEKAFEKIKKTLITAPCLSHFDNNKEIVLQTDMSDSGIGGVLLQGGKPVVFVSKTWTETERRYAPIEKELKAVVYCMHRLRDYCIGNHVIVHSDHKPLEAIYKKDLNKIPLRLQRMIMALQEFSYEIIYKPGSTVIIADTLS